MRSTNLILILEIAIKMIGCLKKTEGSELEFGNGYRRHERIEYADRKRSSTGKGLGEVELRIGIVVVILVQKLHVAIVHQF